MTARTADAELLRSAVRRMTWQIAAAGALVVVLAGLGTLALSPVLHHAGGPHPGGPDHDDDVLRTTLLAAGVIGVLIAGLVGFLVARRAVAPLGDALALQRRFVADAGHELRTPLTALHVRAQLIARRVDPADPSKPLVEQLLADSRILSEIVEELLSSAQLAAGVRPGELFDCCELVDEVVQQMTVLSEQAGVTLDLTAGAPSPPATARGSRTAIRRAITALVDNAIGHTCAGGSVTVAVQVSGSVTGIAVTDTGDGLQGQDPKELTRRFARGTVGAAADGAAAVGGRRFGLGLALVREIAEDHGGAFTLRDNPNGGAVAELSLPLVAGHDRA